MPWRDGRIFPGNPVRCPVGRDPWRGARKRAPSSVDGLARPAAPPGGGWGAHRPLERAVEGGLGGIADPGPDGRDGVLRRGEHPGRDLHAPAAQVLHGRLAHQGREPLRQRRAREPGLAAERVDGPRLAGAGMHRDQCPAHLGVAQAPQPAGLVGRQRFEVPADDLDEHQLGEPGQHRLAARARVPRLGVRHLDQPRQPAAPGRLAARGVEHARQGGQQRVEGADVASQESAQHVRVGRPVAELHREREPDAGALVVEGQVVGRGTQPAGAGEDVGIAVRKANHVAGLEGHRLLAGDAAQASPARHRVELEHVVHPRHDAARDGAGRRPLGHPRRRALDGEEDGAGEAHGGEHVGEWVQAHLRSFSRTLGQAARTPGQGRRTPWTRQQETRRTGHGRRVLGPPSHGEAITPRRVPGAPPWSSPGAEREDER